MACRTFDGADSISMSEVASGSYQFKVNYWQIHGVGADSCVASPEFSIGDHDWLIRFYPSGRGYAANLFVGLDLELRGESKNVSVVFDFGLFDKDGKPSFEDWSKGHHHRWSWIAHTFEHCGSTSGWYQFIKIAELRDKCLRDGCFAVVCTVLVLSAERAGSSKLQIDSVPPWSLPQHMGRLLESKERVDVTFEVGGKTFGAHKLILAARSPVFRAQLFGAMGEKEKGSELSIVVEEMEPWVFHALLHFIYTDEVLAAHDDSGTVMMMQHLLVAADRFAIDKLKLICEEKLAESISAETVATTLALAEQHHCPELRARCLKFAANPNNFLEIALTDGFAHLLLSCPAVVKELRDKLKTKSNPFPSTTSTPHV